MKFGVRECCDVVLRAKAAQKIGNKIFYKNEPVCYFDTLKTSTLEGAATTVYAQGGRGNARLMSWDGERTVTFTMEDALISPVGLSILTGAGLIEATAEKTIKQHIIETIELNSTTYNKTNCIIKGLSKSVYQSDGGQDLNIYVMGLDSHGEVNTEPYLFEADTTSNDPDYIDYIPVPTPTTSTGFYIKDAEGAYVAADEIDSTKTYYKRAYRAIRLAGKGTPKEYVPEEGKKAKYLLENTDITKFQDITNVLVDYYTEVASGGFEIDISADKFGGAYYLEASTLWRDQGTGKDLPAEFIIPNCRVQSNFTFTMASSGDPSSFTFTMDAFPDYTRYDRTEKVLARIQVIGASEEGIKDIYRTETWSKDATNTVFGGSDTKPGQDDNKTQETFVPAVTEDDDDETPAGGGGTNPANP